MWDFYLAYCEAGFLERQSATYSSAHPPRWARAALRRGPSEAERRLIQGFPLPRRFSGQVDTDAEEWETFAAG